MAEQKTKHRPLSQSEEEIALLKGAFADNEYLLKAVRKIMLGFKVDNKEQGLVTTVFKDSKLVDALRKKIYPTLSPDDGIGESSDYWFGTDTEIIGKDADTIKQVVMSKEITHQLLEQAISLITGKSDKPIDLSVKLDFKADPFQINLLARNKYAKSVETALMIIKVIAGQKAETPEQAKKRLEAESNK